MRKSGVLAFLLGIILLINNKDFFNESVVVDANGVSVCNDVFKPVFIDQEAKKSQLYKTLSESKSITFIGDSISEGGVVGGCGWYEPLVANFNNLDVQKKAWGGHTAKMIADKKSLLSKTDVYVIAVGVNDVRLDSELISNSAVEYIDKIDELVFEIKKINKDAKIVLIGLWPIQKNDPLLDGRSERLSLVGDFNHELDLYARNENYLYVNPTPEINKYFKEKGFSENMIDYIHPNRSGLVLYSSAVINSSKI